MYSPDRNNVVFISPKNITQSTVILLYVFFSSASSFLFILSIGLKMIRLTDAQKVAMANFQSQLACIDNNINKYSTMLDPPMHVFKLPA